MATVNGKSACNTSLSQTFPLENNDKNRRDASFSSFLNSTEKTLRRKLAAESNRNLTTRQNHQYLETKKEDDGEIGIFGAEKYFNGVEEESPKLDSISARKYQCVKHEHVDVEPGKPKPQYGTPSIRSESSWDSRSSLLQIVMRNPLERKTNKVHSKSFLAGLGCKCSCYDKDSIDIDEHVGEMSFKRSTNYGVGQGKVSTKDPKKADLDYEIRVKGDLGVSKEKCFTFPTTISGEGNPPLKLQFQEEKSNLPRDSLEVYGSPLLDKGGKSFSLERRLTMMPWDATPRVEGIDYSANSGGIYDDSESDASSELFEIESLTGKANPFLARQASNATSGCVTPTTCYAPSEASIEWSVVTASAADFSVMSMSECEGLRPPVSIPNPVKSALLTASNAKTRSSKEMQRLNPGILLGCKSYKAVRVAGDAYRTNERPNPRMQRVSVSRFLPETKLTGFDSRHR
ncbi:hypothetical protein CFOL_v3_16711 [Cephalotus follicularis]|uniref:Uncharacterized protein n=1 Tax=Cephalotus follicularis TaxID=3775 RepID=A0A1Q3BYX7_CEPFO|nr:hypothetical protein CFOL_v3_16711 [Cephalotus follicularis]